MENLGLINVLFSLIILPVYFYFVYTTFIGKFQKKSLCTFYKAVKSTLDNCSDNFNCKRQIYMHFNTWIEKFPEISFTMSTPIEVLEKMIYEYDIILSNSFEKKYNVKLSYEDRNRLMSIVNDMKIENPFALLSDKESTLLKYLKDAIDGNNKDFANNTLNQLSKDIEFLEMELKTQTKNNRKSYIISILGLLLTIIFGIFTMPFIHIL